MTQANHGPIQRLRADIARTYKYTDGSPARRLIWCIRAPGVHAVVVYRFGQWLRSLPLIPRLLFEPIYFVGNELVKIMWGIELPRAAEIGGGLYIGHFGGIGISSDAIIGENCTMSPAITIGFRGVGQGTVPVLGDNVYIASGARIGKVTIGNNVKIGANTVIDRDIPDDSVVVVDPGFKIVSGPNA